MNPEEVLVSIIGQLRLILDNKQLKIKSIHSYTHVCTRTLEFTALL
jgi:hypothetical protein